MTRQMKDSGVEWIGEIPESWAIVRNKNVFSCSKEIIGKAFETTQLLSLTTKGVKKKDINDTNGKIPESYDTYQIVKPNQIIMCLFDLDCSAVFSGMSKYFGMISPAYDIITCKSIAFPTYYNYWFSFVSENRKFKHYAKNLRYTLKYNEFSRLPIVAPSLSEQQKIAEYLDEKCGAIDEIIVKTEQSIEEYKKLKQSVITEAVTKGIRPNRKMKDSGFEWIGEIPEDWNINKIKRFLRYVSTKDKGNCEVLSLYRELGIVPKNSRNDNHNVTAEDTSNYRFVRKGDFVINKMKAWQGSVAVSDFDGIVSPAYFVYEFISNVFVKKYFHYLLRNKQYAKEFERLSGGIRIGQWDLPAIEFENTVCLVPSLPEQKEIADYLDKKCAEIDTLIEKKQQFLTELATYKKSLIYEYVTGKKEVV